MEKKIRGIEEKPIYIKFGWFRKRLIGTARIVSYEERINITNINITHKINLIDQ